MRTPRALPAELENVPFTLERARALGVGDGALRNKSFTSLGRSIRLKGTTTAVALPALVSPFVEVNEHCAVSHHTAAALYGLPCRPSAEDDSLLIHLIRPADHAHLARPHVKVHRMKLLEDEVLFFGGVPVTSPARTWLDLAEYLTLDEIIGLGDACVRIPRPEFEGRADPWCTVDDLKSILRGHRGKRGLLRARSALPWIRIGSDSPKETELRLALARAGLPEPALNIPVFDEFGYTLFQPDISFRQWKLGVEYDGRVHDSALQSERDIGRAERYARAGWTEVRISSRHMKNDANEAVSKVKTALIQSGWRP